VVSERNTDVIWDLVDDRRAAYIGLSDRVFDMPEVAYTEVKSVEEHARMLEAEGFRGCAQYECKGAGQRVVQELFAGRDWLQDPELAEPMIAAFAVMRKVHDGIELLETAGFLDLPEPLEAERKALLRAYLPDEWTEESLARFATSGAPVRLKAFLPRLRDWV